MATDPSAYREAFAALLDCVPATDSSAYHSAEASPIVNAVMRTLFGLSCSQSGTLVQVRDGTPSKGGGPTCAVLILGFGGASMRELTAVDGVYSKLRPTWKTVKTTMTALTTGAKIDALRNVQVDEVIAAVSDAQHVLVHAMSNNGYGMWQSLAQCVALG
jgi:hypothetical protein